MPYVRLTIVKPRSGQATRLGEILQKMNAFSLSQPGCSFSQVLRPHDNSGEIARISMYEDEHAAEHVANSDSMLSLRSELHLLAEPGHVERAFFSE